MFENEIAKVAKGIIDNRLVTLFMFLLPFILTRFDYSTVQIITLSFGWFFIIIALFMLHTNHKKTNFWVKTLGKVVDIKWHDERLNSGHLVKYGQEVITYTTTSSNKHTVMNDVSNTKPQQQGKKIKIFYNPKNEKEILVYDLFNMYIKFFFLILIGLVMIYYTLK